VRPLETLPKAHLHLHFTGSMRHSTLVELADAADVRLPESLRSQWPPQLRATDERGWFRFQRLYDLARSVLRTEADVRRLVLEAAEDDAAEGSGWLELQVDPSGYAATFGGITAFTDLALDAAADATARTGTGVALVIAANRTRHPLDARTLARLAAQYAGRGVVGFGLSNDERRGRTEDFAPAFRIAADAGLPAVPHAGELLGPEHVAAVLRTCSPHRLGHGVRSTEDPRLLEELVERGIALEVCPSSNLALGVYGDAASVPLPALLRAGATVALGADDPLLFGARLTAQYALAREVHGLDDAALADLAAASVRASSAPTEVRARLLDGVAGWLAADAEPERAGAGARDDHGWYVSAGRRRPAGLRRHVPAYQPWSSGRASEGEADQGGLGLERDAVRAAHAVAQGAGEGDQLGGGRGAAVGEGERVLAGHPRGAVAVALGEAGALDQPGRRGLDPAVRQRPARSVGRQRVGRGRLEHRVGEERPGAPGVVVLGVEDHALAAAQGEDGLAYGGERGALPRLDAEGRASSAYRIGSDRSASRSWKVTSSTTWRSGSALNRLVR
jgi:adenosine deaminase